MSKGPCVYCGNAAVDSRAIFDKQLGHGFRGKCLHCGSTGPWFPSPSDAIHWATHPIHPNDPSFIRLAADEVVVKREHLKNCLAALDDPTRAKTNPGDPTAYGHIQQALAREVGK